VCRAEQPILVARPGVPRVPLGVDAGAVAETEATPAIITGILMRPIGE
jgi:hypothetical protein